MCEVRCDDRGATTRDRFSADHLVKSQDPVLLPQAESALQDAVTKSVGTQFRFFSAEYAFARVYADVIRINNDPHNRSERIERYRLEVDRRRALNGSLTPSSNGEIAAAIQSADERTFIEFFEIFFAIKKIPENAARFDYAALANLAKEAARTRVRAAG